MNTRMGIQPYLNNSLSIRQEIQRFESVHPSIYAIYDLIEAIPDQLIQQQIREHVVCIEDSFVNSQEWTLSRTVPDLRLGILGSVQSGKSALVHRYLTGSYMQEESPEGGRFKKEVVIDGQSYLLLIRDEGGVPEMQFTNWVDAVIFVFSLENEPSFNAIYSYFAKMSHYRSTAEVPLILVGTQDAISESRPRVIDDSRARKLANDLKRCSYYETCATYGLNVERVFQDACSKIISSRISSFATSNSRPSTPNHSAALRNTSSNNPTPQGGVYYSMPSGPVTTISSGTKQPFDSQISTTACSAQPSITHTTAMLGHSPPFREPTKDGSKPMARHARLDMVPHPHHPGGIPVAMPVAPEILEHRIQEKPLPPEKDLPTPSSTPTQSRKNRRRSNLFTQRKGEEEKKRNGEMGSGRAIPVKQGYLYKKSNKPLNKEWKKKYVTLTDDGKLTYHSSLHDYMDDTHGKEINLVKTTVKIPGMKPRGSRIPPNLNGELCKETVIVSDERHPDESLVIPNASLSADGVHNGELHSNGLEAYPHAGSPNSKSETPNVKKRHRRVKSSLKDSATGDNDLDGYEFVIVSLENKQWNFEATSPEEREEWMTAIEQQILAALQGCESSKSKSGSVSGSDPESSQFIRSVKGNGECVDCGAANPDWASLNLGSLICIECSGIHRNLGTHLSRVRSLDLDEWPNELVQVMAALGNAMVNTVWEANIKGKQKPVASSSREDKERWIRAKYESKEFLPPPPYLDVSISQQLIDAIARQDVHSTVLVLAYSHPNQVNEPYSKSDTRTALHIAAALGNLVLVQLLFWYGADVKVIDHESRNALWYARSSGSVECSELLRSYGCTDQVTLSRQRGSGTQGSTDVLEKLPASVI